MLLGTLFFSAMTVFAKFAGERLPTMELVLARVIVTLVMSWWAIRALGIYPWGNNKRLLLMRGFAGFMGLSCYFYAINHLPLADATVIQFCNPMLAALIAAVSLKERLRGLDVFATLFSMAGVVLVAQPSFLFSSGVPLDPVAVVIGASKGSSSRRESNGCSCWGSALPLSSAKSRSPRASSSRLPAGRPPSPTCKSSSPMPGGACSSGVLFFGEYPNAISIAGALLVVLGVFSLTRRPQS
jgi:drug/metabolite transporter (DMT)-like permease